MSSYEISKSSLLSLKAEILRKKGEFAKAKADNEVKIKLIKKNTPLEIKNKGVEDRQKNDITEEEADLLKQSKSMLESKAKLYDKLSSGKFSEAEIERNKRFLVRFDKKSKPRSRSLSPVDFEDSEPDRYPESDEDRYNSEDEPGKDPGDKWVDYTDCLGRTRKCLQKDLDYLMSKDKELKQTVDSNNKNRSNENQFDGSEGTNKREDVNRKVPDDKERENEVTNQEAEMLSSDMRRELLRQQWEKEEEELRDKTNVHYQDILFNEARTHGVGYYGFSKDEEERAKQQQALKGLRMETEAKQKRAQELKAIREKQLAARIKAAKDRRRARLGLPPEEEPEPVVPEPEISEEEKRKEEELRKHEEEKARLLEEARKKHLRPWDIGKEGVKEHYEMTQEEWVEKKRTERPEEFAPPNIYKGREFRSNVKESELEDTDKSLKFTTIEKKKTRLRRHRKRKVPKDISEGSNSTSITEDNVDESPNLYQNRVFEPTPIQDLCPADFDDRLLEDYKKSMEEKTEQDRNYMASGRGVEIAPPPTYDYYGPGASKKSKATKSTVNIENSIEAGLKFLRKQLEEKQTRRDRSDYTSPF